MIKVKFGIDPTAKDLHLGHLVPLLQLARLQRLPDYKVILVIGDFTARIGDPTGRVTTRPELSEKDIESNMETFVEQAGKILDMSQVEVVHNSDWFDDMSLSKFLKLASNFTVAKSLERNSFKDRQAAGEPIHMHEVLYPMLQAFDSVQIKSDVEVGGQDQLTNMLLGRELQKKMGVKEQDIITVPLLLGLDGKKKMSKTAGNSVALTETPLQMFSFVMSISDETAKQWEEAFGFWIPQEHPMTAKKVLGRMIVEHCHGLKAAEQSELEWEKLHQKKK